MSSLKKTLYCTLVTAVFWLIARVTPGLLSVADPNLKLLLLAVMLPFGWWVACSISKGRFPSCIRANLYLLVGIEGLGAFGTLFYLARNLAFRTGQYSTDMNGISYSDYPTTFGIVILYGVVYITLCYYLAAKTPTAKDENQISSNTDRPVSKRRQRKLLKAKIAEMNSALHMHDVAYAENKKILDESFADSDLERMVASGEFPADKVSEYISQRDSLAFFIASAPQIRKMHTGMIHDLEAQLDELKPKKKHLPLHRIIIAVLVGVICVLMLIVLVLLRIYVFPVVEVPSETSCSTESTLPDVARPQNGQIIQYPRGIRESPLTFEAATNCDFLVTMDPLDAKQEKIVFYVRAGEAIRLDICCGEYEVSYAYGKTWYGTDKLFGSDTKYGKLDESFKFENNETLGDGWIIKLSWKTYGTTVTDKLIARYIQQ